MIPTLQAVKLSVFVTLPFGLEWPVQVVYTEHVIFVCNTGIVKFREHGFSIVLPIKV